MGIYINPTTGMSKEEFLQKHGTKVKEEYVKKFYTKDSLHTKWIPVALVQNIGFTAAGVAYNATECNRFISGADDRPYSWHLVPIATLNEQAGIDPDSLKLYMEHG
jgi:hypothetical protein